MKQKGDLQQAWLKCIGAAQPRNLNVFPSLPFKSGFVRIPLQDVALKQDYLATIGNEIEGAFCKSVWFACARISPRRAMKFHLRQYTFENWQMPESLSS